MTAIPTISFPSMDMAHQDEHMDFGSDLPNHENDIEFDVASMPDASRGPSVEPIQDVMIEDVQEQPQEAKVLDDEMVDEDFMEDDHPHLEETMDKEDQQSATMYDDEDLIYEDEEIADNEGEDPVDVDFKDGDGSVVSQDEIINEADFQILGEETTGELNEIQTSVDLTETSEQERSGTTAAQTYFENSTGQPEELATASAPTDGFPAAEEEPVVDTESIPQQQQELDHATDKTNEVSIQQIEQPISATLDEQTHEEGSQAPVEAEELKPVDQPPVTQDEYSSEHDEDEQETSFETESQTLHLVKVQYDGSEICLFPPPEGIDTFFVQDSSLAFSPCDQLLGACRDVLGESIDNGHELLLEFPSLGLYLSENSTHSSQLTLAQILDVYLALSQNDRQDPIPPLFCTLRTRISLASQYGLLVSAVNDGKGLKEVHPQPSHKQTTSSESDHVESEDHPVVIVGEQAEVVPIQPEDHQAAISEPYPTAEGQDQEPQPPINNEPNVDVASPSYNQHEQVENGQLTEGPIPQNEEYEDFDGESDISSTLGVHPENCECEVCANLAANEEDGVREENTDETPADHGTSEVLELSAEKDINHEDRTDAHQLEDSEVGIAQVAESDSDRTVQGDSHPSSPTVPLQSDPINTIEANDFAAEEESKTEPATVPEVLVDIGEEKSEIERQQTVNEGDIFDDVSIVAGPTVPQPENLLDFDGADAERESRLNLHPDSDETKEEIEMPTTPRKGPVPDSDIKNPPEGEHLDGEGFDGNDDDILTFDDDVNVNGQSTKRKAQDEDDYDLIDFSTPEKKKSRSS